MNVVRNGFEIKIEGKCLTNQDILDMWNFGYSLKGIAKKYAKDNKIKKTEADKIVEDVIYRNTMKK